MISDPFSLVIVPLSAEIARFSKNIQLYKKYSARDKAPVEHTVNWKGGEFSFKKKKNAQRHWSSPWMKKTENKDVSCQEIKSKLQALDCIDFDIIMFLNLHHCFYKKRFLNLILADLPT